jgi:hypothetical protein
VASLVIGTTVIWKLNHVGTDPAIAIAYRDPHAHTEATCRWSIPVTRFGGLRPRASAKGML